MALDDSEELNNRRSSVIHSADTSNNRRSVSEPPARVANIEPNSDASSPSPEPPIDHVTSTALSSVQTPKPAKAPAPPPVGRLSIRQNGRIDWSDISNNAIGCYSQRFEAAYVANSRFADLHFHIVTEQLDIPAHSMIVSVASAQLEYLTPRLRRLRA